MMHVRKLVSVCKLISYTKFLKYFLLVGIKQTAVNAFL